MNSGVFAKEQYPLVKHLGPIRTEGYRIFGPMQRKSVLSSKNPWDCKRILSDDEISLPHLRYILVIHVKGFYMTLI